MGAVEMAWALADCVDEQLRTLERHWIYVSLGSGDTDSAIIGLVIAAVRERILLPRGLIEALQNWNLAHDHIDAKLGTAIASIPIAPEPRHATAPKKSEYLNTTRNYRRS